MCILTDNFKDLKINGIFNRVKVSYLDRHCYKLADDDESRKQ